jgi:hypothetical protein
MDTDDIRQLLATRRRERGLTQAQLALLVSHLEWPSQFHITERTGCAFGILDSLRGVNS